MLAFLLDEQISHVVMEQLRPKRPDIHIESVQLWRNADLRGKADELVLAAAYEEGLTLVTYDQKTIPPILMELALAVYRREAFYVFLKTSRPVKKLGYLMTK